jgi:hypothetical protein
VQPTVDVRKVPRGFRCKDIAPCLRRQADNREKSIPRGEA